MKNLPDKIYLNFGEITKEESEADDYKKFCKLDEYAVTFCEDRVYDTDVEYVRKDAFIENATIGHKLSLRRVAKLFFELGIKIAQKGDNEENIYKKKM